MMNNISIFIAALNLLSGALAANWDTYPEVPRTASINGFADPIYSRLPECAQDCVEVDTGNTPCPYWDTGCLCVMGQWSGMVADCFAEECSGSDVASATSLAYSLCSRVGADIWLMPASISAKVSSAAGTYQGSAQATGEITDTNIINVLGSTTTAAETGSSSSRGSSPSSSSSQDSGEVSSSTLSSVSFISIAFTLFLTLLV